jgi:arylsulfatase
MYGVMEQVFVFAETFDKYPPRSIPPSFNPTTILDQKLMQIKAKAFIEKNIMPRDKEGDDANANKKKK